jgi:hypothetical protein
MLDELLISIRIACLSQRSGNRPGGVLDIHRLPVAQAAVRQPVLGEMGAGSLRAFRVVVGG